ncbi:MAG: Hsp20/alpha crystallin family protein [Candidatus Omnitrophota bacterium]|jgi:HSP20 family protein|nr:MAG: Hsp20/alpha crystallin family protein [Candidatus Omnitrophota bacterium]
MARRIRKSRETLFVSEDCQGQSKNVFEFHYHEPPGARTTWNPNMDILETPDDLIILVEAAGLDKNSIRLQAVDNRLILSGDRRMKKCVKCIRYHQLEIQFLPFVKTVILPGTVDVALVKAEYENGLLEIRVAKRFL